MLTMLNLLFSCKLGCTAYTTRGVFVEVPFSSARLRGQELAAAGRFHVALELGSLDASIAKL